MTAGDDSVFERGRIHEFGVHGTPAALSAAATALWAEAAQALPADADHTKIARWLNRDRFPPG